MVEKHFTEGPRPGADTNSAQILYQKSLSIFSPQRKLTNVNTFPVSVVYWRGY